MKDIGAVLGKKPMPMMEEPAYDADLETAMTDLMAAIKSGDAAGAAVAFKAAHAICAGAE